MMNQPLRRVDPLGRSATPAPDRETHAPPATWIGGSVWPIRGGSMRAIVDIRRERRLLAGKPPSVWRERSALARKARSVHRQRVLLRGCLPPLSDNDESSPARTNRSRQTIRPCRQGFSVRVEKRKQLWRTVTDVGEQRPHCRDRAAGCPPQRGGFTIAGSPLGRSKVSRRARLGSL